MFTKNEWESIKGKWISSFINSKNEIGFSINKVVTAEMEWVAEAYMETDYSVLKDEDFKILVLRYLSFSVLKGNFEVINDFTNNNKKIDLKSKNWKLFSVKQLFEISLGKPLHKNTIKDFSKTIKEEYLPYITRTTKNNGTEFYVNKRIVNSNQINKGEAICVGAEGFEAFYQKDDFITGNKVSILRNKNITLLSALFLNTVLNLEFKKKFGYGRGLVKSRLENLFIKLPSDKNGNPDFEFMENYIKSLPYSYKIG